MLPTASPDVIFAPLDGGAVIFSTTEEVYYGLNSVGVRVWEMLPPAKSSLDELCLALHQEFADVDIEVIRSDVTELLDELIRLGLVTNTASAGVVAADTDGVAERAT